LVISRFALARLFGLGMQLSESQKHHTQTDHSRAQQEYASEHAHWLHMRLSCLRAPAFVGVAVLLLVFAGCAAPLPTQDPATANTVASDARLTDISNYVLVTPEAEEVVEATGRVITEGSRANVRTGPGLDAPIIAKANPGDTFQVIGRSEDNAWWQICCVRGQGDAANEATATAWIAAEVFEVDGDADSIAVNNPLLPDNIEAVWQVDWLCGSERCEIKQCSANVDARVAEDSDSEQWLQVEHSVTWDDDCFETDSWVFEVDRFTGRERSGEFVDNFLYNYWLGGEPGPATNVYTMDNGRKVVVWCSGPHEVEIEESGGWTTVYRGDTCHDVRTGTLVSLSYTKRWLFTGEFDGQRYQRAYFGDYETLVQHLIDTNAELDYITEQ
jgi:hypothetical protein